MARKKNADYIEPDTKLNKMAEGGVISYAKLQSGLKAIRRLLTKARLRNFLQTYCVKLTQRCRRLLLAEDKHLATLPDHYFA